MIGRAVPTRRGWFHAGGGWLDLSSHAQGMNDRALLLRLRPEPPTRNVKEVGDHLGTGRREIAQADYRDPVDVRTVGDFVEPARRLREVTNAATEPSTIAHILWLNHSQPHQTRRALAKAVNVHHGTVSRILDAWGEHREDIDGVDQDPARQ